MSPIDLPIVFNTKSVPLKPSGCEVPVRIPGHWHPHVPSGDPIINANQGVEISAGFYVYVHRRRFDKIPFYVGKGCHGRAWDFKGRSKSWQVCVMQGGLQVDIWYYGLTEQEAFDWEKNLIEFYLATERPLVNVHHNQE